MNLSPIIKNKQFLLINDTIPHTGLFNMEFDTWLYHLMLCKKIQNAFRIYEWSNPSITHGKFQKIKKDIDIKLCFRDHIEITKRPTGGRAIIHFNEITFSMIFHPSTISPYNFRNTFILTAELLKYAFQLLHIQSHINMKAEKYQNKSICFRSTAQYEIKDNESNKLAGIAQYFTQKGVLIQGSIPLAENSDYNKYFYIKNKFKLQNQLIKQNIKTDKMRDTLIKSLKKHLTLQNCF